MSDYVQLAAECSHDTLRYLEIDSCEPDAVYENWRCEDCGATIIKVLEPQHQIIEPRDSDNTDQYIEDVGR